MSDSFKPVQVSAVIARFESARSAGQRVSLESLVADTSNVTDRDALLRGVLEELERRGPGGSSDAAGDVRGALMVPAPMPHFDGYHVIETLGQGGMGMVYEAYHAATGRRVAIKSMLPSALERESARRRFEREVELAARLEHPGIASIIDSGVLAGRYFYVMEFVDGKPLDQAFDPGASDPRQVLSAVAEACDAVDYAHQRGILHRDLKPSNILFDKNDRVRIVDFGLAKAFDPLAPGALEHTTSLPGQLVGTLAYMAPEQARGQAHLQSVRSDVYALGAITYELLTGELPIPTTGPLAEALELIAHRAPRRPSTVRRGLDADIDAILQKALAKDPAERYATASALADDLRAWLAGRPIQARPLPWTTTLARWARRHTAVVSVAAAAAVLLAGVLIERFVTLSAERDAALSATRQAKLDERRANRVVEYLQEMLTVADPDVAGAATVPLRAAIDLASTRLDKRLRDWPLERSEVRQQLGGLYLGLGLLDEAEREYANSLSLLERHGGAPYERAESRHGLGRVAHARSHYDDARPHFDLALRELDDPENGDPLDHTGVAAHEDLTWLRGRLLNDLGWLEKDAGRVPAARVYFQRALELRSQRADDQPLELAETLNDLAHLYYAERDHATAERLFRQALDIRTREADGAPNSEVAATQASLGGALRGLGRQQEAEALLISALETRQALLGPDHPDTLVSRNELALLWREVGRDADAVKAFREVLDIRRQRAPGHRDTAASTVNLALAMQSVGELDQALALCTEALGLWGEIYGERPHANVAATYRHRASILRRMGRLDEAEADARLAIEISLALSDTVGPGASLAQIALAQVLVDRDEWEEALQVSREARATAPAEPRYWADFAGLLEAVCLANLDRAAETPFAPAEALERIRTDLPETHLITRDALALLRDWQARSGDAGAAAETAALLARAERRARGAPN